LTGSTKHTAVATCWKVGTSFTPLFGDFRRFHKEQFSVDFLLPLALQHIAKFWLDPVELAKNLGFANHEGNEIERLVREHREFLIGAWHEYFDA
jgi:hypothetical protein